MSQVFARSTLDALSAHIAVLDEAGNILGVNKAWRDFAQANDFVGEADGSGLNYLQACDSAQGAAIAEAAAAARGIRDVIEGRRDEYFMEYACHGPETKHWFQMRVTGFQDDSGDRRVVVAHEAVDEIKLTQGALQRSENRLRHLLETTHVIPWESDARTGRFTYVGPQALELGYPLETWYEEDFWPSHIHPEDRDRTLDFCLEHSRRCQYYGFEYRMIAADARIVWLHDLVTVERVGGEPDTLRGFMIDITERKQAEATLRDLRRRLIHAQEEERKHIARELHDDLNQRLASLAIEMGMLRQRLSDAAEPTGDQLTSVQEQLMELSEVVHHLSHELHPGTLEHLGLAKAVQAQCDELRKRTGIRAEVSVQLKSAEIPRNTALCVYRVTQEALRNVARHSAAADVRVTLTETESHLELSITDSGRGFVHERGQGHPGIGLLSMEERVRLEGGTFSVRSEPGKGTQIEVTFPWTGDEARSR